ncbi:unnamed protein product [Closterium sp. NIES-54]
MAAAKRVLRYLCSTSGMGLVLGGRRPVVLTGHADASWADDQATQRSSQGYTFSLGSGSVSWWSTRSSSVLSSSCEAKIYAGAMAAQELRWLTYLLTDLGEQPRSPPVLYVDNKAMLALCREHRLEHRTKHIALRYFLACELQQRGQVRLAYVASEANTADIFTKALAPGDHQRFCTLLAVDFEVWLDDLQLFLQCDSKDGLSLFDLTSGASTAPTADADSTVRSQWLTRDAAARLVVCNHLPSTERAHFSQYKSARALYDTVVARYSSPTTAALSHLMLPYLFPDLAAFSIVADLVAHLRTSVARYRAALPTAFLPTNSTPMYITLYYLVIRLLDSLSSVRDHFLSLCPTELTVDLLEERLAAAEKSILAVGASRDDRRTPFFEGCSPVPLLPSVASAATVDLVGTEEVGAAFAPSGRRRTGKGKGSKGGGGGGGRSGGGGGGSGGGGPGGGGVGGSGGGLLPCPAAPSCLLSGLHLPSFSTNLVSGADLQDAWVDQFTPGGQRVTHCTCSRTGRHLATFTRRPGSSLFTLTTAPPPVPASGQVAASSQVFAALSRSSPASAPCSCRPLAHKTLLWHHRLGHPSLPRL